MTFALAWVAFPVLFAALALGSGLLLEYAVGRHLPTALLLPSGFAVVIVAASLMTMTPVTAGLTSPLVVALAVAGIGVGVLSRRRVDPFAAIPAIAVFAVYAAPIVLSGSATFAGYISLDDTSTWLALSDHVLVHGRSLSDLAPSTYMAVLRDDIGGGYPVGAFVPLGIGHELTGIDAAWLFQPYIAFVAAMLSLTIYALVTPLVRSRGTRVLIAFVGAQSALLFGYAFWSGVKEVIGAYLIALIAALAVSSTTPPWLARASVPVAIAAAALLACSSMLGAVWLVGFAVVELVRRVVRHEWRPIASVAVLLGCVMVLSLPTLATARVFVDNAGHSEVADGALGNLFHPLSRLQLLGIWPVADFRGRPSHMLVTYLLIGVLFVAAAVGIAEAARRRSWGVPVYAVGAIGGCLLVLAFGALGHGSPWLDGKALASASPAVLVAGLVGAALLFERRRRAVAVTAFSAIAFGVVWSNALAFGSFWLAPRAQLAELETIGKRFAGDGPALMTEYQPYGVRHFLRNIDAEGASERRVRPIPLRDGRMLDKGEFADLDAFQIPALLDYRTLVLRTSPLESRPPSVYQPLWIGRWYEVWQRPAAPRRILAHLPLGTQDHPSGVPSCAGVRRLAALAASSGGSLVAAVRPDVTVIDFTSPPPVGWTLGAGGTVLPSDTGTVNGSFSVARRAATGLWLGGSFRGRMRLSIDGREVGSATDALEEQGGLTPLATVTLPAGVHGLRLRYDTRALRPGERGAPFLVGPLWIGAPATASRLLRVPPRAVASLCGRSLDWIEAVS